MRGKRWRVLSNLQKILPVEPLVSVGIPTYNRPNGLRRTLECITGQTYKNLEIIVSDNCSPGSETETVVREFMANDPRIHYYRQGEKQWPTYNFRFVLEKPTGEYFMWAADDDEWKDIYIERCLKEFFNNDSLVLCYSEAAKKNGTLQQEEILASDITTVGMKKISGIRKLLLNQYRNTEFYSLTKTSVARSYKFKNFFGEDHAFILFLALHGQIGKTDPGLFINGPGFAGRSPKNTTQVMGLHKINNYLGYISLVFHSIKMLFEYKFDLTIFEKMWIVLLIIRRAITRRYLFAIIFGFMLLFRDIISSVRTGVRVITDIRGTDVGDILGGDAKRDEDENELL